MATQQWQHVHSPKVGRHPTSQQHQTLRRHPAMAARPLPQSWSSPYPPTIAHHNGTLRWHPAMAARPLPQSCYNGTLGTNGTASTLPKLVVRLMGPSNGNTSTAPCNGTLIPRPIRQSGSSPSPPIGSKNPYSYRYLGNNHESQRCNLRSS